MHGKGAVIFCALKTAPPPFKFVATNPLWQVLLAYTG